MFAMIHLAKRKESLTADGWSFRGFRGYLLGMEH